MKESDIRLEISDGVASIILAAPRRRNALTVEMSNAVIEACDRVDGRPDVAAVVIRAEGPTFCAGADRSLLLAATERTDEARSDLATIYRSFERVRELATPTIAAVRGYAIGAGVNLALAADVRIVADDALLVSGFTALALHPGGGHAALIADRADATTTAAMALFGQPLDAAHAVRIGLAWESVGVEQLDARALEIARGAGVDGELARAVKASLRRELGPPRASIEEAMRLEAERQWWSLGRSSVPQRLQAARKPERA